MQEAKRNRWLSIVLSVLVVILSSWKLWTLPLWGHWCLPWFLSFWFLMVSIFSCAALAQRSNLFLLSSLSGLLLFLGFPTMPLTPLLFVAFIPLLLVIRKIAQSSFSKKGRKVLFYSYNSFVIWNMKIFRPILRAKTPTIFHIWIVAFSIRHSIIFTIKKDNIYSYFGLI